MIPRFDLRLLKSSERRRKNFLKAATSEIMRLYFHGNQKQYLVMATPNQLYTDMLLTDGSPVSIFLIPFPPFISMPTTEEDRKMVKLYQVEALQLMGIDTKDLFSGDQLNYRKYYQAIRRYDGSEISLPAPLETFARKLLPPSGRGTGLVSLKRSKKLTIGVRPAIVWKSWTESPELYGFTPGLNLPKFDKAKLQIYIGTHGDGEAVKSEITQIINAITLEEL
jgi:hypothetical protein